MSLHSRLKEATRSLHDESEQLLFPNQTWSEVSLADYRYFLRAQYLFHGSIEQAIDPVLGPSLKEQLRWKERQKIASIERDLNEIQASRPTTNFLATELASEAEALGFLYVSEGSTLGGRMIYKALQNNEQVAPYSSFRFLKGYRTQTGKFWKEFLQVLEQEVDPHEYDVVIEASRRAFGIFSKSLSFIDREVHS